MSAEHNASALSAYGLSLIGRIHGAIVAATVGAIVAAIVAATIAATVAPCIHCRRLSIIVAATNTRLIEQPTGDCRHDDRLQCIHVAIVEAIVTATIAATIAPTGCGDDRPVYTPCNGLGLGLGVPLR